MGAPDVRIDESLLPPGLRNGGSVERERSPATVVTLTSTSFA